jgi:hypothetical protein
MYLSYSQIQGLTWFMGEGNLEQRMQVLSSEEGKGQAALMKLQKLFQSHQEGPRERQEELVSLEVLCALRTLSLSQPLVMMMRRAHTGRNHPLSSHLQQLLSARGRARTSAQLAMSIVRAPERMTVMVSMKASQFLDRSPLRVVM